MKDKFTVLPRKFAAETIEKSYSRVAPFYDFWSKITESKAAQRVLELARVQDGEQVLEVAVGTGLVFAQIVKQNENGRNAGIDISPSMLSRAQKRLQKLRYTNYHLEIGNAYKLPFEDNTFDLIVNNFMFDLLPQDDFVHILSEFKRVLKPSGRVVISTMSFGEKRHHRIWYRIAKSFPSLLTGCRPVSLHEDLVKAGFVNIHSETVSQNTFPSEILKAYNS